MQRDPVAVAQAQTRKQIHRAQLPSLGASGRLAPNRIGGPPSAVAGPLTCLLVRRCFPSYTIPSVGDGVAHNLVAMHVIRPVVLT